MSSKKHQFVISVLIFFCVARLSLQCLPPLGWTPMPFEERVRRAPLVVRANVFRKIPGGGNLLSPESFESFGGGPNESYKACLNVTHVYKGNLPDGEICPGGFGEAVFCKTDLSFGVTYVVLLNIDPLSARYEFINPAAAAFNENVFAQVERGVCCSEESQGCQQSLICPNNLNETNVCECR